MAVMKRAQEEILDRLPLDKRERLEVDLDVFRENGIRATLLGDFSILVTGPKKQYYFYPFQREWRSKGKTKRYSCRGAQDFIDRFVLS